MAAKQIAAYDPENVFQKILDGAIPSFKIFETEHVLAILDAFPLVPGHSLLIPKAPYATVLGASASDASTRQVCRRPRIAARDSFLILIVVLFCFRYARGRRRESVPRAAASR